MAGEVSMRVKVKRGRENLVSEEQRDAKMEYEWQRGVESLQGQVTAARSGPLFREKKIGLGGVAKN